MVYLTGDTHGDLSRVEAVRRRLRGEARREDFILVLGDFGFVFNGGEKERAALEKLGRMRVTFLFVDGNHENFDRLSTFPEQDWNGGRVHRVLPNVLHLMRGQVFTIEGRTYFTMGGAYSPDKPWRTEGRSWWAEEMPSAEEYETARRNLLAHGHKVDFILTHTAPQETTALRGLNDPREAELGCFLDWVQQTTKYSGWYFGHVHRDRVLWRRQTAVFDEIVRIGVRTGER